MQSMVIRGLIAHYRERGRTRSRTVDALCRRDLGERESEITTLRLVAAARLAARNPKELTDRAIKSRLE
jgi:hypothetical protein